MATLKLAVLPKKIGKDGSHKIRIAIGHKQKTCYIVTRFKIESLLQFKEGQIIGRSDASMINVKLRNLLNDYQDRLDAITTLELYSCSQLREALSCADRVADHCSFKSVAMNYVQELNEDGRQNYALLIERNCKYFTEYARSDMPLSQINPTIISNYARYLRNTKCLGETTIGMMMSRTRTIINRAKREQLVRYDVDPFEFYSIAASAVRELDISVSEFKMIRDSNPTKKIQIVARDLFCLSYYLCGINLIDLLKIDFRNLDKIEYIRTKSRNMKQGDKRISVSIPPEAVPIIIRWRNAKTGLLDFGYQLAYRNFSRYLTRELSTLAKGLSISSKVVYYSARKSFVQHGFDLGISLEVLEYCIGQSMKSNRPIFNYLKIMRRHADVAIRKILDHLKENSEEELRI